jgi:hypothetical protein
MFQKISKQVLCAAASGMIIFGLASSPVFAAEPYVVEYRLEAWKTAHFHESPQAETHLKTLKSLGCEVKTSNHDGHLDVAYRCPQWRSLAVNTDAGAHKWEGWLRRAGFETAHQH